MSTKPPPSRARRAWGGRSVGERSYPKVILADWPVNVCDPGHTAGVAPRPDFSGATRPCARSATAPRARLGVRLRRAPAGLAHDPRELLLLALAQALPALAALLDHAQRHGKDHLPGDSPPAGDQGGERGAPFGRGRVGLAGTVRAMAKATKVRLDNLLARRGLFASPQPCGGVGAGRRGAAGRRAPAGRQARPARDRGRRGLASTRRPEFVSRGGRKLANALAATGIDPAGRRCLDVGASTGGFTDCLLQRGAAHVVALDVAYGELHWRLRTDPRVTVLERANARALEPAALPYAPDLIVIDVSFISLAKVLPAVLDCAAPRFDCLALVKPQFEAGREQVGRGGVVRDPAVRRAALVSVGEAAQRARRERAGLRVVGPAGAEGQPGDVRLACRVRARGRCRGPGGGGARGRAVSGPVVTVITHRRPEEVGDALDVLRRRGGGDRGDAALRPRGDREARDRGRRRVRDR